MKKTRILVAILMVCSLLYTIAFGETKFVSIEEEAQQTVTAWVHTLDNYIKPTNIQIGSYNDNLYYSLELQNVSNVQIDYVKYQFKIYDVSDRRLCYETGLGVDGKYHTYEYNQSTGMLIDSIAPNTTYELLDFSSKRAISAFKTQSGNSAKIGRIAIAVSEIFTSDGHVYCVPEESWTWYDSNGSVERGNPAAGFPQSITDEMKKHFLDLNTSITDGSQMYDYIAEIYGYPEGGCYVEVDRKCIVNDVFGLKSGDVVVQIGSCHINSYEDLMRAFLMCSQENSFVVVYYDGETQKRQERVGRVMDDDALLQKLSENRGKGFDHSILEGLDGYSTDGDQWEYSAYMDNQENRIFIKTTIGSDMPIPKFYIECDDFDLMRLPDEVAILVRNKEFKFSDLIQEGRGMYMFGGNRLREVFLQISDATDCSFEIWGIPTVEVDICSDLYEPTECLAAINQWAKVLEATGYWDQLDEDVQARNEMRFLEDAEQIEILNRLDIDSFDPKLLAGLAGAIGSEGAYILTMNL